MWMAIYAHFWNVARHFMCKKHSVLPKNLRKTYAAQLHKYSERGPLIAATRNKAAAASKT